MRFGNQLLAQEHHVQVPVLIVVKHHAILQAHSQDLLMAVQIVQPSVTTVVPHVRVHARAVVEAAVVQRNVSVAVRPIARHHVVFNVLKAHIVIKQND